MIRIPHAIALSFLCVILAACQTLNVPAPTTFNQKATAAYNALDAAVQTTGTLLQSGKITPNDAQQAHDQISQIKSGVDIAVQVHTNDPQAGEDRLATAITALTALQAYLAGRQQ